MELDIEFLCLHSTSASTIWTESFLIAQFTVNLHVMYLDEAVFMSKENSDVRRNE